MPFYIGLPSLTERFLNLGLQWHKPVLLGALNASLVTETEMCPHKHSPLIELIFVDAAGFHFHLRIRDQYCTSYFKVYVYMIRLY